MESQSKPAIKLRPSASTFMLLLLGLAIVVGLVLTRDTGLPGPERGRSHKQAVDEKPLETARDLAKLVSSWEEQRYAQQALRIADHEVDLAFASALRTAAEQPAGSTPQGRELYTRVNKAEAQLKADQSQLDKLKKELATASGDRAASLQQELALTQAQLELDEDDLDDAKSDLARSGADSLGRVQRQFNRYQATQQNEANRTPASSGNFATTNPAEPMLGQFRAWRALYDKQARLKQAQDDAALAAAALAKEHDSLEAELQQEQEVKQVLTQEASKEIAAGQAGKTGDPTGTTAAAITSLHQLSLDQKDLAALDKRIQAHQELHDTYGNWIELVKSRQALALRALVRSTLWIVLVLLLAYLAGRLVDRFAPDLHAEHSRMRTLRTVMRFAIRVAALLFILAMVLGTPQQMPTILGLAGAGLTVALGDFIIAFIAWFLLMGRNGIRVGDWVEINGVTGEVIEINLFRTVLLETGNWTDTGHPTGRKVAFVNSYAIQGHFFNFSTSGQWLWDEISMTVPPDRDPYAVIDAVQQIVAKETEANMRAAEEEWQRATSRYRAQSVSAKPAIDLRPTGSGVEVHVRYITRAEERYAMRTRLYQALVGVLHGKHAETTVESAAK